MSLPITKEFYTRFKNVVKMLQIRGYDVEEAVKYEDEEVKVEGISSFDGMTDTYASLEEIDLIFVHQAWIIRGESSKLRLVYLRELEESANKGINENQLASIIADMDKDELLERTIIISHVPISNGADKRLKIYNSTPNDEKEEQRIEFFDIEWFTIDRLKHRWVPEYVLLTDREIEKLLRTIQASKEVKNKLALFPTMRESDPIALYYGIKPKAATPDNITGKVFKIKIKYPTPTIQYRLVVENYEVV